MAAKIITLASAKGGSGKTLITASFSAFLSNLGKKVLMIDTDASTNGLTLMYLKEVSIEKELLISRSKLPMGVFDNFSLELDRKKLEMSFKFDTLKLSNGVFLLPATYNFHNENNHFPEFYLENMRHILSFFREEYDFIFIDSQAGSDEYAEISVRKDISDEVVIVSEYDPLSAAGVERLKGIFRDDLTYNRTWYLLNKMIPEFIQSFSDFLEIAKYLNPIPWDADVVRAYARRRLPLDLENGNEFTLAIIQTLQTLLGEDMSSEIEKWKKTKEDYFKKPLDEQHNKLLAEYNKLKRKASKRTLLRRIVNASLITSLIIILIFLEAKNSKDLINKLFITDSFFNVWRIIVTFLIIYLVSKALFPETNKDDSFQERILERQIEKIENLKMSSFEMLLKNKKSEYL